MSSSMLLFRESDSYLLTNHGYIFKYMLREGSFGKVWLCNYIAKPDQDDQKEELIACKVIDTKRCPKQFAKKFLPREIEIFSKVHHPHIIELHSIYKRKENIFIFMRYAEKGDLLDHILINGEVHENQAKLWAHQIALALQYLHRLDIVHRDIKCDNILITGKNNVKLSDFGFSRFMTDSSNRTLMSKTFCGSVAYVAPEILQGTLYDPKKCDAWSLGIVIYIMLNQCMPFNDNNLNLLLERQIRCKWRFRSSIRATLTDDSVNVVNGLLQPNTEKRLTIEALLNHSWFIKEACYSALSYNETIALDYGEQKRKEIIPTKKKILAPWRNLNKKETRLVCFKPVWNPDLFNPNMPPIFQPSEEVFFPEVSSTVPLKSSFDKRTITRAKSSGSTNLEKQVIQVQKESPFNKPELDEPSTSGLTSTHIDPLISNDNNKTVIGSNLLSKTGTVVADSDDSMGLPVNVSVTESTAQTQTLMGSEGSVILVDTTSGTNVMPSNEKHLVKTSGTNVIPSTKQDVAETPGSNKMPSTEQNMVETTTISSSEKDVVETSGSNDMPSTEQDMVEMS